MPTVTVNSTEIDARLATLQDQRTKALNDVVILTGTLAARDEEISNLKSRIAELEKPAPAPASS